MSMAQYPFGAFLLFVAFFNLEKLNPICRLMFIGTIYDLYDISDIMIIIIDYCQGHEGTCLSLYQPFNAS